MAYTKTNWTNNTPPAINAANLDKIEEGISDAHNEKVDKTVAINTTTPLTGGGPLIGSLNLGVDEFTATARGAVPPPGTVSGKVLTDSGSWAAVLSEARTISTDAPLTGGGPLTDDLTLAVDVFTATVPGVVPAPGVATGQVLSDSGAWVDMASGLTVDGDKGDITVGGGGSTLTIDNEAVTYAKMQLIPTNRLLGRATASTGVMEEIICTAAARNILANADAGRRTLNAQTATTYTPVLGDENKMVTLSNAGTIAVTLPSNTTLAVPISAEIEFLWLGTGQPSFVAGSGATVNSRSGMLKISAQYGKVTAKKISTNGWLLTGDLAA